MAAARRIPTRTCVACRTARAKRDLLRIVRTPGRDVVVDPTGRLAGRGAYVCDEACLAAAIKKGALRRALDTALPATLIASVDGGAIPPHTTQGGARGQE